MRDAGRVNKFLVKARGSWQRRWSSGTRGSRLCQAPGDERQEHIAIQRTKWCMACVPVQVVLCQIHWWKNVITAVSQHGLWPNVGFRGFSAVPQIMEEIMDDMHLVPQGHVQDRIVALIPPCHRSWRLSSWWSFGLCLNGASGSLSARTHGLKGLKAGETMDLSRGLKGMALNLVTDNIGVIVVWRRSLHHHGSARSALKHDLSFHVKACTNR